MIQTVANVCLSVGLGGLFVNLLFFLGLIVYRKDCRIDGEPPPDWVLYPMPPLLLCFGLGVVFELVA